MSKRMRPGSGSLTIIQGKVDHSDASTIISENREVVMILTTSMAVLIGCMVVLIWRKSSRQKHRTFKPPKPLIVKEIDPEVKDEKKKVTIFFGTQTGTAEGFARVKTLC